MTTNEDHTVSVVDRLRRDIVNGVYRPRERLVEAELAERYGVNRSAMRAAVLELAAEGLVERDPRRSARVKALTIREGIEIAQVRRELESLCARLAAERATDVERRALRGIVKDLREAFEERNTPRYLAANTTFHTAIIDMAQHEIAHDILTRLGNFNFNQHFPMAFSAPVPSASEAEHERVAEAIIRGDGDEAAAAMYDHLEALIEVLQAQETGESPVAGQRPRRRASRGRPRSQIA